MPDSRSMLLAQLYDWEHDGFEDDLDLYAALARRTGGPVLEIACGSGRVLEQLARAGFDVVGLDCSKEMLARARARLQGTRARVDLVPGDLNGPLPPGPFGLIILALDAFGLAAETDSQVALLERARDALRRGGAVVLDLTHGAPLLEGPRGIPVLQRSDDCEEISAHVTKWIVREVAPSTQGLLLRCFYDLTQGDGSLVRLQETVRLRYFSRYEVELLLAAAGLELEGIYGDYALGPLRDESERMIVLARAKSSGAGPPLPLGEGWGAGVSP